MSENSAFYRICDKLSLWMISLFALECVLGCSGRWLSFGGLSIRMVLFALCFFFTLPNVFSRLRSLIRSPFVILTLLLGVYFVIAAIIGWQRKNNPGFIVADITGFLTLALMPGFLATICSPKRVGHLTDVIFWGALVLGAVTTGMHLAFSFMSDRAINQVNSWINAHSMGGLSYLQTGMHRIYFRSQIFLQVGLMIGLYKSWRADGWKRWLLFLAEGVILFGCLMSYTRSFWLGFAVSALLLLLLCPQYWKKYFISVGAIGVVIAMLFSLSWASYRQPVAFREFLGRFNPALISGTLFPGGFPDFSDPTATEPTEDPSVDEEAVNLRRETLIKLNEKIRQHPIFGSGLGTNLDGLREDGKTEYMYQDVLMKTGILGFSLFLAVFFLPTLLLLIRTGRASLRGTPIPWDSPEMGYGILATAVAGVAVTCYGNPFMLNPMGILLVLLTAAAAGQARK